MKQPYCRYCGGKIKKRTISVWFNRGASEARLNAAWFMHRPEKPTSKAEVQRLFNQTVVSVSWWRPNKEYRASQGEPYIRSASIWDGESYVDPFFCAGDHAKSFGYACASAGYRSPAYDRAIAAEKETT